MSRARPLLLFALVLSCARADVRDLEPLCGTWRSLGDDGSRTEERWWRRDDGLRGENHTFDATGRPLGGERLALTVRADRTIYRAEPDGSAPTEFTQVHDPALVPAAGERVWIWDNPAHDFPRRIVYRLAGDRLTATISDPDGDDTRRRGITWEFRRIAPCAD
ncbi:MAG TPA: hypothetical protein VIK91_10080 [Nannocystis sp.]